MTATNTAGPPIGPGGGYPKAIAITPDGQTAYVVNTDSGTVTPIATATNTVTVGPSITVGSQPDAIAITPDAKTVYIANSASGTVTPISTTTNTAGSPITVGGQPDAIAITEDGQTALVANAGSGTVTPIATATSTAGAPIAVGDDPDAIAITPATTPHQPAITSRPADTAPFGQPYIFTVTTTGAPVPWLGRAGRLPSG